MIFIKRHPRAEAHLCFITARQLRRADIITRMQVHSQAPVYQTNRIFIQASPEKVWSVLTHIPGWVNWNPKITQAQISETPRAGGRFTWKINGASIKSLLHTVQPQKAFGWSGVTFGGSAIHNWYLEAKDGGTWVSVEESMEGWLIVLFKGKMNEDLKKDMQLWLELLKGEAEQGTRNKEQFTGNSEQGAGRES